MDLGLRDKVALVLASSKGMGKASARALAAEGCKVVLCARKRRPSMRRTSGSAPREPSIVEGNVSALNPDALRFWKRAGYSDYLHRLKRDL